MLAKVRVRQEGPGRRNAKAVADRLDLLRAQPRQDAGEVLVAAGEGRDEAARLEGQRVLRLPFDEQRLEEERRDEVELLRLAPRLADDGGRLLGATGGRPGRVLAQLRKQIRVQDGTLGAVLDDIVEVARKLATTLIAREPLAEITALADGCFRELLAAPHIVVRVHESLYAAAKEKLEEMKAGGMTVIEPDVEAFRQATMSVIKEFEETWGKGLYEKIQAIQ